MEESSVITEKPQPQPPADFIPTCLVPQSELQQLWESEKRRTLKKGQKFTPVMQKSIEDRIKTHIFHTFDFEQAIRLKVVKHLEERFVFFPAQIWKQVLISHPGLMEEIEGLRQKFVAPPEEKEAVEGKGKEEEEEGQDLAQSVAEVVLEKE